MDRDVLGPSRLLLSIAAATAENYDEEDDPDGAGNTDHDAFVVVDPRLHLTIDTGAFALTLRMALEACIQRPEEGQLTFWQYPPPPHGVPSR